MTATDREPFTARTAAVLIAAAGNGVADLVEIDPEHRARAWNRACERYSAWGSEPDANFWQRLWAAHCALAKHVGDLCPTCWNPDGSKPVIAGHAPLKACDHCGAMCRCNCDAAGDWAATGGH